MRSQLDAIDRALALLSPAATPAAVRGGRARPGDAGAGGADRSRRGQRAIRPGEFIGVFGPNGSGKTTLLRALLGLLPPVSGEIRVFGATPGRGNSAAGYLPQQRAAVADLPHARLGFCRQRLAGRALGAAADWPPRPAGGGPGDRTRRGSGARRAAAVAALRRRIAAAAAGAGAARRARILLLDEPLISLDPHFQQAIVALVKRIQRSEASRCCSPPMM